MRNVTTSFAFAFGRLADEATLPPINPVSVRPGGRPRDPEESVNWTVGAVFNFGDLDVTIDYFNIELTDRIALTDTLPLTDEDIAALVAEGVTDALGLTGVRFFTNDFDTTTQGIDVVATYPMEWAGGVTNLSFIGNWTETEVDKFNPEIITPDVRVRQLEDNLPNYRFTFMANHTMGPWRALARARFYDKFFEANLGDAGLPINAGSRWLFDAELAYTFNDTVTLIAGGENIFDTFPTRNPCAGIVGAKYPETSPYGFNGGFYYLRAVWDFR